MKKFFFLFFIIAGNLIFAQFGQNKVQFKNYDWYYIQTKHFDIYFSNKGENLAEFASKAAEDALKSIQSSFNYEINNRITLIVYNSTNDFQETNVTDQYLTEGIEGFTELFKNRVVIQYMGSYKKFRHLIHHELVHAVINDLFYGGSVQNIIANNISVNLPLWFNEGMAEFQALGWDVDTDMYIRDAAINEYLPDLRGLDGYFAYRGGQSVFYYIAKKYGKEKIGELISKVKGTGNLEEGLKLSIGLDLKELNERWKKDIKQRYWPDIATRKDPDEFAKRLTDHKEDGGFYNTSPALSPQGDKIAFLTNRNFFFDVYLMNANDGKIIKRLVEGNRSGDFEELNILTPGLTWSPDGKYIALASKYEGFDVIYLIDVESEDNEILPIKMDAVRSVTWSPDGKTIAFIAHNAKQSDIYLYDIASKQITNLTNDIFTENDPAYSLDGNLVYFSSDRTDNLDAFALPDSFKIYNHNYEQSDIYSININDKNITRITDMPFSDETSPIAGNGEILFISDVNGIANIYKKPLSGKFDDYSPITNSLNGLYQLSVSKDRKKLTFSTMYESAFNIFLMNNPFDIKLDSNRLAPTLYMAAILKGETPYGDKEANGEGNKEDSVSTNEENESPFYTGNVIDTNSTYGDSIKIDFDNYVFGNNLNNFIDTNKTKSKAFDLTDNLDDEGNFKVNKYKITFSPDIIYANAGYNTLYGLQGTTVLSFSDILGNHRLIGVTSLQIDLKNSDYGLAYYYLPNKIDFGIEGFHTARFVALSRRATGTNYYRFRNYGVVLTASYPLSRFYRFDAGISYLNVSSDNLDFPEEPQEKVSYLVPSLSFIHDNVLWGYTSPIEGVRYRLDVLGHPLKNKNLDFISFLGDYRKYFRFWYDYSFAFRLSGGFSNGHNKQRFFIGGIENWINRKFATGEIPLESTSDFAFLSSALPLRGYDYAEQIGTRYALMNLELRFPLIRYLVTGALPILFSNILGTVFIDAGTAWNKDRELKFFSRDANNNIISQDLLMGTGFGARVFVLYFLLRFDVAWAYNVEGFSKPKFYFSLGADF